LSRRDSGKAAEDAAARHLRASGYKILERNFSTPVGEIDIVALDGEVICFVEVRSHSVDDFGSALEALTKKKQRKVARAAQAYLRRRRMENARMRFDFAAVELASDGSHEVNVIKSAFWPGEIAGSG